ncbi:patatin-like phospholipase domain-containing protein [Coniochaeta ligniaria NRRL 30616]|uniref:Patatin-like phospholipase domain-containing protein n=1 Tax=Coniochaeta ligniaria NRRL 30616 TaxID=1408157 RepID=A0A1J7JKS7_9PEZI|nr:patatin-like phospholipase domain-containing protein [Coniochaeta ligniaria NRRL 30616]
MAKPTDIPSKTYGFPPEAFDPSRLPDIDTNFLPPEHLEAFIQALSAPDPIQTATEDGASPSSPTGLLSRSSFDVTKRHAPPSGHGEEENLDPQAVAAQAAAAAADVTAPSQPRPQGPQHAGSGGGNLFITAANDWAPVHERVKGKSRKKGGRRGGGRARKTVEAVVGKRSKDETREGYLYGLLKWPFLLIVGTWILGLGIAYLATRLYIWTYEHFVAWRGTRDRLRRAMRATSRYEEWVAAARKMDEFLGNEGWKEENEFAYYDSVTVRRVWEQMRKCRAKAERVEGALGAVNGEGEGRDRKDVEDLRALIEACVKNNFVGVENPRLYSQTYYGTKNLVQNFVEEVEKSLKFLINTKQLTKDEKRSLFKGIHANYGRTALCLSGGASFAYYHFGVVKALLEANLLPDVITGTSGGALVAGLVATRTNDELRELLVPALSYKITACREPITVWFWRWWKTGARFDSVDWAKQCSWWTRGSMTFREAYERTGRILNVSCVPADPHSPTILCNYLTSPDCVIWSAVLASAAVPGILNPVVLMMKTRTGQLVPYSFGHKWKDGSLRTDIPIKALNMHFNVNFTIVSQVNPHINLFFFSSRGTVGSPVTHRRGRGWRGGYLGSATEQYLKLDLNKWLKVLRHLELLPRPLGQDWSQIWLQQFVGTITIWPRSVPSDFIHILDDPNNARMARMIHEGQQSAFPKLKFIANRLKVERLVEQGRRETRPFVRRGSIETIISEDDLRNLLRGQGVEGSATETGDESTDAEREHHEGSESAVLDGEDSGVEGIRLRLPPGRAKET